MLNKSALNKIVAAGVLSGSLLLAGVGIASAQSTTTAPAATAVAKPNRPANGGFSAHAPAIAKALGITVDQLNTSLAAGKTIAALATEKGVNVQTIIAAYVAEEQAEHPDMAAADVAKRVADRVNGVVSADGKGRGGNRAPLWGRGY